MTETTARYGYLDLDIYSTQDLAVILGVHTTTVLSAIKTGKLHGLYIGGPAGWRFAHDCVMAWIQGNQKPSAVQVAEIEPEPEEPEPAPEPEPPADISYNVKSAARLLKTTEPQVLDALVLGLLEGFKADDDSWRVKASAIGAYLRKR